MGLRPANRYAGLRCAPNTRRLLVPLRRADQDREGLTIGLEWTRLQRAQPTVFPFTAAARFAGGLVPSQRGDAFGTATSPGWDRLEPHLLPRGTEGSNRLSSAGESVLCWGVRICSRFATDGCHGVTRYQPTTDNIRVMPAFRGAKVAAAAE
jgi:hypothetical protein